MVERSSMIHQRLASTLALCTVMGLCSPSPLPLSSTHPDHLSFTLTTSAINTDRVSSLSQNIFTFSEGAHRGIESISDSHSHDIFSQTDSSLSLLSESSLDKENDSFVSMSNRLGSLEDTSPIIADEHELSWHGVDHLAHDFLAENPDHNFIDDTLTSDSNSWASTTSEDPKAPAGFVSATIELFHFFETLTSSLSTEFEEIGFLHEFFHALSEDFADLDDHFKTVFGLDTAGVNSQSPIEDIVIHTSAMSEDPDRGDSNSFTLPRSLYPEQDFIGSSAEIDTRGYDLLAHGDDDLLSQAWTHLSGMHDGVITADHQGEQFTGVDDLDELSAERGDSDIVNPDIDFSALEE